MLEKCILIFKSMISHTAYRAIFCKLLVRNQKRLWACGSITQYIHEYTTKSMSTFLPIKELKVLEDYSPIYPLDNQCDNEWNSTESLT